MSDQTVSTFGEEAGVSACRKVCKWLSWSTGTGTYIFEYATVAWVCICYWRAAFGVYFALSTAFVAIPAVLTAVTSLLWLHRFDIHRVRHEERQSNICDKRLNPLSVFVHLLSMGFVYRYVRN